jgi:hypothetical protein
MERPYVLWDGEEHWPPLSRMGIGADISPLGIGLKSAVLLTEAIDGRLMFNYFNFDSGRFEIDGFNADVRLKLGSAAASLDWYPFKSIWRFSVGTLFLNHNQITASTRIVAGTSFTLDGTTFYSASANPTSTVDPLTGTATLNLNSIRPALTLAGGFGRYIPRSRRHHWSFPSEFGVAFTGTPKLNVATAGTVCLDAARTQCANLADSANPAVAAFNQSLQGAVTKWRRSLASFDVYPLISYGVVYSFTRPR